MPHEPKYSKDDMVWIWSSVHNKPIAGIVLELERVPPFEEEMIVREDYIIYKILADERIIKLSDRFLYKCPEDCRDAREYVEGLIKLSISTSLETRNTITGTGVPTCVSPVQLPVDVLDYIFEYGGKNRY